MFPSPSYRDLSVDLLCKSIVWLLYCESICLELLKGNNELDCFYDAQKIVYDIMEKKFYQDFVLSHDYTEFVCQSELANEEYRAQSTRHDEPVNTINWSDGFGFKERVSFANKQCNLYLRITWSILEYLVPLTTCLNKQLLRASYV